MSLSRDRDGIIGAIIAIVVILIVVIIVIAAIFIIPFREVRINESKSASIESGVDSIDFNLTVDSGRVDIRFVDDNSTGITMTVTGQQRSGIIGSGNPVNVSWQESRSGNTLVVSSIVKVPGSFFSFFTSHIDCNISISKSLRSSISVNNSVGTVNLSASQGVSLTSLDLRASTGGVSVSLSDNASLGGPMVLDASTGGVNLVWNNASANGNASVDLRTSVGGIRAVLSQNSPLGANMSLSGIASLGGIDVRMMIGGNNSAHLLSHANRGGVSVQEKIGFNGTNEDLASQNYPNNDNFEVALNASTGGISLNVRYGG